MGRIREIEAQVEGMCNRWRFLSVLIAAVVGSDIAFAQTATEELEATAKALNIQVVRQAEAFSVKMTHGPVRGKALGEALMAKYAEVVAKELALYSAEFMKKVRIQRVVVCKDLDFNGQSRNAVPDYEHGTLYLEGEGGMYALDYMRLVIHHELFHIVDYRDDGVLYDDTEWKKLNLPGFSYGRGGIAARDATASLAETASAGFLNAYSKSGVEEDKAEVFAYLMVDAATLTERCKSDPVLAKKTQRMKELCQKFCAQMDAAYWAGVEQKQKKSAKP